jgi:hypothetical protein
LIKSQRIAVSAAVVRAESPRRAVARLKARLGGCVDDAGTAGEGIPENGR